MYGWSDERQIRRLNQAHPPAGWKQPAGGRPGPASGLEIDGGVLAAVRLNEAKTLGGHQESISVTALALR
jgi:hypothetical protein